MAAKRRSGMRNVDDVLTKFNQFKGRVDFEELNLGQVLADSQSSQFVTEKDAEFSELISAVDSFKRELIDAKEGFKRRYVMQMIEESMKSGKGFDQIAELVGAKGTDAEDEELEEELLDEDEDDLESPLPVK